MPRIEQKWDVVSVSSGDTRTARIPYLAIGYADETSALNAALASVPSVFYGLNLKNCEVVERVSDDSFEIAANYDVSGDSSASPVELSFDTTGKTARMFQSLATVSQYSASGSPPNFGGAIGVTKDSVEGVDVQTPGYSWEETHYFSPAVLTVGYRNALASLTGTINNALFRGFQIGEVLFKGARGRGVLDGVSMVPITFIFEASPNVAGLTVGDMTGIYKGGWDYLWVYYTEIQDASSGRTIKYPLYCNVERVMRFGNFNTFGIGA